MSADLTTILSNVSKSLVPVQSLITGFGYLIGLTLMITALMKLKKIGDHRARGHSQEKMFVPLAYFLGGAALIFLPSAITVLSNTAFGSSGNVLQYTQYNPLNVIVNMKIIIQTAGLIWFVRGCILLVHASEPGVQHGPKGLAFLCAGVMAVNFEGTMGVVNYIMHKIFSLSKAVGG